MNEFLNSIKPGQYIKTEYRDSKYVRKVSKVTATQIVISEFSWSDEPHVDRFKISNGCRLGDSWYSQHRIVEDHVTPEEIAIYEANKAEGERMRKERKRLNEIEAWAKGRLIALLGIPADQIKVQFSSNDGMKTGFFEIKCEKVSESVLVSVLNQAVNA